MEPEDPVEQMTPEQRERFMHDLEESMRDAAKRFDFKKAAEDSRSHQGVEIAERDL